MNSLSLRLCLFFLVPTMLVCSQELVIQKKELGGVELQILSERADRGYRVDASPNLMDWFSVSNHSVGSQTLPIAQSGSEIAFYRLNIWDLAEDQVKLVIIGDSTAVDFSFYGNGVGGWGESLDDYFGANALIANLAQPGQSTRTYLESTWQIKNLTWIVPDFVLIQFGMIDELSSQPEKRTTIAEYQVNLQTLVELVRGFGGTPILVSPITLREFGEDGKVLSYLDERSNVLMQVADSLGCPGIDLNQLTKQLYNRLGEAGSVGYTHTDRLHLLLPGAKAVAGLVAEKVPEFLQSYRADASQAE